MFLTRSFPHAFAAPPGGGHLTPAGWLVLLAIWLAFHPWSGFHHDGILYAAQALRHLRPEVFGGDPFFAYGSQDDYTVFGRLYAAVADVVGLVGASRLLWAIAQLLWLAAAIGWIRRAMPDRWILPAAGIVFALPACYGSDLVLRVAEPFLTARSFAEPLAAAGVLAVLHRRNLQGALLLAGAGACHPIMTLPGVFASALIASQRLWWRRPVHVALAAFAAFLLAWAWIDSRGLPAVDDAWYRIVRSNSPIVTADAWRTVDWARMLLPLVVLECCARAAGGRLAVAWRTLALTGFAGLSMAVLAAITRWDLALQAQFWRMGWLAAWAAPIAALAAAAAARERPAARLTWLAAIPALAAPMHPWTAVAWMLPAAYAAWVCVHTAVGLRESRAAAAVAGIILCLGVAGVVAMSTLVQFVLASLPDPDGDLRTARLWFLRQHLGWAAVAGVLWAGQRVLHRSGGQVTPRVATVAAAAALASAGVVLDARAPSAAELDRLATEGLPAWDQAIPPDASVYWPEHARYVWIALRRRSYASNAQLAGAVFSRDASLLLSERIARVAPIGGRDATIASREVPAPGPMREATPGAVAAACSDPSLDFVVARGLPRAGALAEYRSPVTGTIDRLYRCEDLRRDVTIARPFTAPGR